MVVNQLAKSEHNGAPLQVRLYERARLPKKQSGTYDSDGCRCVRNALPTTEGDWLCVFELGQQAIRQSADPALVEEGSTRGWPATHRLAYASAHVRHSTRCERSAVTCRAS